MASQGCVKGNVAIHPQDATHLNDVLPPTSSVIHDMVCAVFVGESKPTKETIQAFKPILVRKSRLKLMIDFLIERNPWYTRQHGLQGFNQQNFDDLFGPGTSHIEEGILCAMEIGHIQLNDAVAGATAGYVPEQEVQPAPGEDEVLVEAVGYTECDDSPIDYDTMTMKAIAHCLSGGIIQW
ncbi:uncharacterized protein TRAVEDRAFT_43541 [Trametes versicolor FP-101664 SS1]|uniref:uncharacterized protein n=1 Tax=Trametes versicolor (strain FP-101664) TaxID=717944 RepID=UPI000462422F|nr:uncharacterized protein TRAVEDRAFT_43541 [Trametes versicolor FP-101664 SS1]EIW63237.1 hypothetical protein TRAVEDRAFT_43541 [Trametes versicolor FP-101664 SS1]